MTNKEKADASEIALTEKARKSPSLKLHERDDRVLVIDYSGDLERLMRASDSAQVAHGLLMQVASIGSTGKSIDEGAANFALGFIDAMQPKDAAEALLLAQMAATHQAAMMMARRLNHVENLPQQDSAERAFNKLMRSYAAQMDTLKRYRSKGQQTVRVERVTVQDGGRAIVGSVEAEVGGK